MRVPALLAGLGLFAIPAFGAPAPPQISRARPTAVRPGETVSVAFEGDQLSGLTNLWTSFPCKAEFGKKSESESIFQITVASNVPVQIGGVRLAGSNALSELHLMMVDDLPTVAKTNATEAAPQQLKAGTAVEGAAAELQADYFSFSAKAKESVSIEALARRIGSALDPLLRVLDQNRRELVYSFQYNEPNGDPKIRFIAPSRGSYLIELRDVSYRGGPKFFYRLRFGKFPLITAPLPAVAKRGAAGPFEVWGRAIERAVVSPRLPSHGSPSSLDSYSLALPVNGRFPGVAGAGFSQALLSSVVQIVEKEPNDNPEQATKISLPCGINGRFQKGGDLDYYELLLEKGDRLSCVGRTRSLGVPCDVTLQLLDTNNTQIAESKNTGADEGLLSARIEKTGLHRLLIQELTGAGRPDFVYHLDVENDPAGFALSISDDHPRLGTNGSLSLEVACKRDGYDGAVKLSVEGLEGSRLESSTIAAKKTNTTLRIFLPKEFQGSIRTFQVFGEKKEKSGPTMATTIPALRRTFPNLLYGPEQLNGLIWIAPFETKVSAEDGPP